MYGEYRGSFLSGPVDELEAQIQSKVGEFLISKQKIMMMMNSPSITVKENANELYGQQIKLEGDLKGSLAIIEKVKTDSYSISEIGQVGMFYYLMQRHISDVNSLYNQHLSSGGIQVQAVSGIGDFISKYKWYMLGGLAAIVVLRR